MYRLLLQSTAVSQAMGRWANFVGEFDEVFGYSYLGDVFLRNPSSYGWGQLSRVIQEGEFLHICGVGGWIAGYRTV